MPEAGMAALLAVFAPLAVHLYRRKALQGLHHGHSLSPDQPCRVHDA
jgi:hypothetical protein